VSDASGGYPHAVVERNWEEFLPTSGRGCVMRIGRMSSWASALVMASGGMVPGLGSWPLMLGAWEFHHTNDGGEVEDWR
jgi:hypothetical protein